MQWAGRQAVVTLPEHIGVSSAGQIREELPTVIDRGAATLTATLSCDHAGANAVVRAYQRAAGATARGIRESRSSAQSSPNAPAATIGCHARE